MLNAVREMHPARRRLARLLLGVIAGATLFAACRQAPPPEASKPRRHSFEESTAWKPSSPRSAPAGGAAGGNPGGSVDAQAQQVQQTWEQARQANSDAERQRLANEALKQTRSMAEQPSGSQ
jgi:hypothetical protein